LIIASAAGPEVLGVLRSLAVAAITVLIFIVQVVLTIVVLIVVVLLSPLIPLFQRLGPMIDEVMKRVQPSGRAPPILRCRRRSRR
jgi:hypothetical protein